MKNFKLTLLASALIASGSLMAATDGNLDTDSTGSSVVTIIKENAVQISKVNDLNLGTHATLAADETASDDVCVFNSTGGYRITISGGVAGFALTSGTDTIPYTVGWSTTSNGAAPSVTHAAAITGQNGDSNSLDCGGATGVNANFSVTVSAAAFNAASPGTYTDTLTLFVEPE